MALQTKHFDHKWLDSVLEDIDYHRDLAASMHSRYHENFELCLIATRIVLENWNQQVPSSFQEFLWFMDEGRAVLRELEFIRGR